VIDGFGKAARGEMSLLDVIGAGELYSRTDRNLAVALYSTWLASAEPPMAGPVWYNLAVLLEAMGEVQRAVVAFRKAVAMVPHLRGARHGLLRALLQDSKRLVMGDGGPDEAYLIGRGLLGKGALATRRTQADKAELGVTLAYYAFVHEGMQFFTRAEYLYETFFAEGGESDYFQERLDDLARARVEKLPSSPTSDVRLRCVTLEIVDGAYPSAPVMSPETIERCLANIDVNVISTLRLFARGEPLSHPRLLNALNAVIGFRRTGVRTDLLELWTDGHDVDMVMVEEVLRCNCIDGIIVRCEGDGTAAGYRKPRPSADWRDLLQFFDRLSRYRDFYDIDISFRAWIRADSEEDRQRWRDVLTQRGWIADFAEQGDTAPPLYDGLQPSLTPGDGLAIAIDGSIGPGESLLTSSYSRLLADRNDPARKLA
jgi:hypothetical protein